MANITIPGMFLTGDHGSRPAANAVGKGSLYACSTHAKVYQTTDGSTWTDWLDATGSGSGGGGLAGRVLIAAAEGIRAPAATSETIPAASAAYLHPICIAGPMQLRAFEAHLHTASSGTWQWGLFDATASASAATKLAGGSGALNGTGLQSIVATNAPVTISPGAYMLVVHAPASSTGLIYRASTIASRMGKSQASYTWDDTPDFTTGWNPTTNFYQWWLIGDVDDSETQW